MVKIKTKYKLILKHLFAISIILILISTLILAQDLLLRTYSLICIVILFVLLLLNHRMSEGKQKYLFYMLFVITNVSVILTFVSLETLGLVLFIYCHFVIISVYSLSFSKLNKVFLPNMILFILYAILTSEWIVLVEGLFLYMFTYFLIYNHVAKIKQLRKQVMICQRNINESGLKDSLSGLYNNAYIYEYLNKRIKHINNGDLSVLMMDIDNFKRINDLHGHIYGDKIIKQIASLLRESTSEDDVLGRYGGEEFIAILNNADFERSINVAEDIRTKIEKLKINSDTKVTISIGIAFYNNDTAEELIKKADDQLFHAKKLGKNRVKGEKEAL